MRPRAFLRNVVEGYPVVVISVLIGVIAAVAYLLAQPTEYRTSTTVHVDVGLPASAGENALDAADEYENRRTATYKSLVTGERVLGGVIEELDLDVDTTELDAHVDAVAAADTNIIEIRVTWPDADESAEIANAVATHLVDEYATSNPELRIDLEQVRRADAAAAASVPSPVAVVSLSVFAGLLMGAAVVFVARTRRARRAGSGA
jgi:capsular polysaccharide biosynthesis protein